MKAIYYTRVVNCFLGSVWGQYWTRVTWTSDQQCTLYGCKKQAWWWHRSAVCTLQDTQLDLENVGRGPRAERRIYYTRVVNLGVRSGRLSSCHFTLFYEAQAGENPWWGVASNPCAKESW